MKLTKILALLFFLTLTFSSCQNDNVVDRKQNFDNGWKFHLGDIPEASNFDFDDSSWRSLDLPHDWSIEGTVDVSNPSGNDGGYFPTGIGWYRKSFIIPEDYNGKLINIHFEGIYMNSEVFINGKSLGIYPYGYSPFSYDLTKYLHIGEENIISIKVDNSKQKNSRWYTGSGIYRHVWLEVTNPTHIDHWGVFITTPKVTSTKADVLIKTKIKNGTDTSKDILVSYSLFDQNHNSIGNLQSNINLKPNSFKEIAQSYTINNPNLWSPESPFLYTAEIALKADDETIDQTTTVFGIRTIEFTSENGFLLNGKETILNGGCVHHDNGCLGAASYDRAEERKVELLKQAGFNAVRTAHNIPSEAFLEACDRLGLLVIDEAFDGWKEMKTTFTPIEHDYASLFDKWWKTDLQAMVKRDKNHPSIIMWSIGNEIIERTKPEAVETARMLSSAVKELDSTRPVTSAMTSWNQGWEIFDPLMAEHDICGYNYMLHEAKSDHDRVPSRVIMQTESYPKDAFFCWDLVSSNPYIIGDFVWTAIDYLGESGIGRWYYSGEVPGEHWERDLFPWHASYCGDIDLMGIRKPISHYRDMLYNDHEKLYMAVREPNPLPVKIQTTMWGNWPTWESWTWPEQDGKMIEVEVYSKYEKVRLYLNDTLMDEKTTNRQSEYKAIFEIPYQPGTLKAVGVQENKEKETKTLMTAGNPKKLKLTADRKVINANRQDLVYISIEVTDQNGIINPNTQNLLQFEIEGPGIIAGVDNGDIKDTSPYVSNSRRAFYGRALVILKSTDEEGTIKLNVTSENLETSSIQIVSQTSVK